MQENQRSNENSFENGNSREEFMVGFKAGLLVVGVPLAVLLIFVIF